MSTTFRADRAAEAIRMVLAAALTAEVQDPRLHTVTITEVEVSHDLQNARIFYTVRGDEAEREDAAAGFRSAAPFLRRRVAEEVPLRAVPELQFRYDTSNENAMRINELLAGLPELQTEKDGGEADR